MARQKKEAILKMSLTLFRGATKSKVAKKLILSLAISPSILVVKQCLKFEGSLLLLDSIGCDGDHRSCWGRLDFLGFALITGGPVVPLTDLIIVRGVAKALVISALKNSHAAKSHKERFR